MPPNAHSNIMPPNPQNMFNISDEEKICEKGYDILTLENIVFYKENPTLLDFTPSDI
jgi:hypothetical protein